MSDGSRHHEDEVVHLNVDDLEIEELEQRLELASVSPAAEICIVDGGCDTFDCGTFDTDPDN
ncbi:MAG TPA: hypothetical protein VF212_13630 [Longimicrobiales bacterium]